MAYNDYWYAFLGDLGYTGALNDRFVQYWKDQITPRPWLLSGGLWNDEGAWRDTEQWEDS